MSKKKRDHSVLEFHELNADHWIRVYDTHETITFRHRHTGKRITLRY